MKLASPSLVLLTSSLCWGASMAFRPSPLHPLSTLSSKTQHRCRDKVRLYQSVSENPSRISEKPSRISEKPSRIEIERAAGQKPSSSSTPHLGSVQGIIIKDPDECTCYTDCPLLQQQPELRDELAKLVEPRSYPLFLAEKAAKYLVDDIFFTPKDDDGSSSEATTVINDESVIHKNGVAAKERLVILGAGWGSAAFLQGIDNSRYDVTIISPRNYFLFTPMLAGASVGTVDVRSITRPIREFNRKANYLEAAASAIDIEGRVVKCSGMVAGGEDECEISEFEVPYDRLVIAVGARINTFGIPGVQEYCSFLKQVEDAVGIRKKVINLFERANLPGTTEEQKDRLLTFAIIGAGPSGVEFAGELRDFIEEDGPKYYPNLLKHVKVKIIEATPVVLRPFDKTLQDEAIKALTKKPTNHGSSVADLFPEEITELVMNKRVEEVTEDVISLSDGRKIPYGLAVWAGGIGPLPITLDVIEQLGGRQKQNQVVARGRISVDPWLRTIEGEGRIFAMGDCCYTQNACLPATAQVAAQQGEFLAHLLNAGNHTIEIESGVMLPPRRMKGKTKLMDTVTAISTGNHEYLAPFQYWDLGILAYTGENSALAQLQVLPDESARMKAKGKVGFGLWRSIYLMKQASVRNMLLVSFDWTKSRMFGRDITLLK